jgi:hypothetical protein
LKKENNMDAIHEELEALKRRLKRLQIVCLSGLVLLTAILTAGFTSAHMGAQGHEAVLRVRGLVIEDDQGHPRILLGAPTPNVEGRKRTEGVDGIVLLGENGADRVVISYPGLEPQVMGTVRKRSILVPSAGLMINDADGDERAGFGVSDDGSRVSLGLDYADRDAMGLVVSPGFSGLGIFARNGERNDQITMGVTKDGTAMAKLADTNGDEHLMAEVRKDAPTKLLVLDPKTSKLQDVTGKLVP